MIRDILIRQKRELENKYNEKYIERDVDTKKFDNDLIKVIIGPRRAGKSFLATHILQKAKKFAYVNFDDEKLVEIKNYDDIINELNSLYNKPEYLFFDEIQNLQKWELFVNRLQRQGYNLVITGSNSKLLSHELATHLTGRHLVINIFPFSFKEYLRTETKELTKAEIKNKLSSYLTYGGYPEPLIKSLDYKDYLSTLFDSIIYKDVVKRFKIRFVSAIEELAQQLITNTAKEFSYNQLVKTTKCKSVYTAQKYLDYLEEAFMFFKISRFSYKVKEQIASNKKVYCIDNGFIHAKAFKLSPDLGKLYENAVAIKLKKIELDGLADIY
nr:ATP-binding protein [Nanoarchaeota archaeon]